MNKILIGDCLIKLKELEDNSVDSIVTDPPYELGFMGKSWDSTGIANNVELWKECLRVLKPGGHLLAFSGTRTYHRMASAIEDAGFEVRDMIEWVYGSGFPKSHNIGKNIEKIKVGGIKNLKQIGTKKGIKVETGTQGFSYSKEYVAGKSMGGKQISGDIPVYEINNEWEGWGTALKPAHEPICMARKPLSEKTVAENCLKWGTGGINIDESRVEGVPPSVPNPKLRPEDKDSGHALGAGTGRNGEMSNSTLGRFPANLLHDNSEEVRECFPDAGKGNGKGAYNYAGREYNNKDTSMFNGDKPQAPSNFNDSGNASRFFKSINEERIGRFPANLIHDNSEEVRECFPETKSGSRKAQPQKESSWNAVGIKFKNTYACDGSEGSASRFFKSIIYNAKASKSERTAQGTITNAHPTIKPISLMTYLIKMVTPKGGIVLDPFAGSGSTLVAAKQNGYQYIGIEMTEEYIPIIEARLNAVQNSPTQTYKK